METRSTFNLSHEILNWKKNILTKCEVSGDDALELESHLLDEVDYLKSINLSDEEAFFVAQKRIGSIRELKGEYAKVNPVRVFTNKIKPFLLGILAYLAFISCTTLVSNASIFLCTQFDILSVAEWNFIHPIILSLFVLSLVLGIYYQSKKRLSFIRSIITFPLLLTILVISKILNLRTATLLSTEPPVTLDGISNLQLLGLSSFNYAIFQIVVILLIMGMSLFTYFFYSKRNTYKVVELQE